MKAPPNGQLGQPVDRPLPEVLQDHERCEVCRVRPLTETVLTIDPAINPDPGSDSRSELTLEPGGRWCLTVGDDMAGLCGTCLAVGVQLGLIDLALPKVGAVTR